MNDLTYSKPTRRKKKPGITARYRAKRRRAEGPVMKAVRAACVERDGYCRVWLDGMCVDPLGMQDIDGCGGLSEWAHLENQRRGRTRGMKPELRHTTAGTAMLCRHHHRAYDAGTLRIVNFTGKGADGPLTLENRLNGSCVALSTPQTTWIEAGSGERNMAL